MYLTGSCLKNHSQNCIELKYSSGKPLISYKLLKEARKMSVFDSFMQSFGVRVVGSLRFWMEMASESEFLI